MSRPILLLLLFHLTALAYGQQVKVKVGINDRHPETSVMVSPASGKYAVVTAVGDTVYRFRSDDVVSVTAKGDSLHMRGVYGLDLTLPRVSIVSSGIHPRFVVKRNSDGREMGYPGSLMLTAKGGKAVLINVIELDTYVSHVVQSESGSSAEEEYYKIQSIICRTYVMGNVGRHASEGFDVCDHQHCQVYQADVMPGESVARSAAATSGIVMADAQNTPILAAFHANCGGQTANSEDVWATPKPYLVSVKDTFCTDQRSATWTADVPLKDVLALFGMGSDSVLTDGHGVRQPERMAYLEMGGERLRTADIRRDLRLRSSFFDMQVKGDVVQLSGRGFGHGVGLCQQGAMRMAREGLTYPQILGHYYTGVSLVNLTDLK